MSEEHPIEEQPMGEQPMYGLMAEFEEPEALVVAARRAREKGYQRIDAYTPFPVEGLSDALVLGRTWVPVITLLGGLAGGFGALGLQIFTSAIDYPLNVGGRPPISWPSFVPVTFEGTILIAGLAAALGMIALNGLPQPYHPVFNVPEFARASRDRFFLVIEEADPRFDWDATRRFLEGLNPHGVFDVPA